MSTDRRAVSIADEDPQLPLAKTAPSPVHPDVVPHYFLCHVRMMKMFVRPLRLRLALGRGRNSSQDRHGTHLPARSVGVIPTRFFRFSDETRPDRHDPVHGLWMFRDLLGERQHFMGASSAVS